jgi:homoserine dehydrogenase
MPYSIGPKIFEIVQYGVGGVGRELIGLVAKHAPTLRQKYNLDLRYRAVVGSKHVLHVAANAAVNDDYTRYLWEGLRPERGEKLADQTGAVEKVSDAAVIAREIDRIRTEELAVKLVVVDVTGASDYTMNPVLIAAMKQGHAAVLANKRPLCAPIKDFDDLIKASGQARHRLRYETTVGAALPVISTLKMLEDSFDTVQTISGTFSGTLGYLTTRLEEGASYSEAVREAKEMGYTEPDPRDDLGGIDVARKALILARTLGYRLELSEVEVEPLYPASLAEVSIDEFMARISELDAHYNDLNQKAANQNQVLRYVASVKDGQCKVGLESVPKDSQIGRLRGTDNIVLIQSERYSKQPLVIQGAGAGRELTASGVLADMVSLAK